MHRVLHVFVEWIKLRWSDFERHLEMQERLEGFLSECRSLGFQNEASVVTRNMSMRAMRYQKRNPVQRKTVAPGFTFTENTPLLSWNPKRVRAAATGQCAHLARAVRLRRRWWALAMDAHQIALELANDTYQLFRQVTGADVLQQVIALATPRVCPVSSLQYVVCCSGLTLQSCGRDRVYTNSRARRRRRPRRPCRRCSSAVTAYAAFCAAWKHRRHN